MYPKLLSINPSGEDRFTGGSQSRIAAVIAANIGRNGYQLIGIDGPWGAGKSNVIDLVRHQMKETHHFFVYDAWSHQEDLQRRSFLEELNDSVTTKHLEKDKWDAKLKEILSK
jgi:predicted KAP-like P-loop ATPase